MFDVVRLVHLSAVGGPAAEQLMTDLTAAVSGVARRVLVQPTLPGVRNGGDVLAHLRFAEAADWQACAAAVDAVLADPGVTHVDGAEYDGGTGGFAEPRAPGSVYRVLLLRVAPQTPDATVDRFEADLLRMPRYIPTMLSWRLSRVRRGIGSVPWTHVWEQEFTDLDGLDGPYLMHPVHWAHVDRWFDPECPDVIVHDRICHSFCENDPA
ncbi:MULTISPECIES: Dabb family protein [unclassified Nocardia]|uniref:Dabb family protein n=1 Tax=unclassified Nocardia TaxID=2637762 RepID=UPI0033B0EDFB